MDPLVLSMKATTFLGVVLAVAAMNVREDRSGALARRASLAAGGVALMVANVWLAATPLGLVVDAAYAGAAAWTLAQAARRAPVAFEVLDPVPA